MKKIISTLLILFLTGCSTAMISTNSTLPQTGASGESVEQKPSVSLFELNNYTDTPRAGSRSSNIIEGILLAKGFTVTKHFHKNINTFEEAKKVAFKDKSDYFIVGGVSEWRYKTGIDGEPAVSLQCSMYETKSENLVWSATGSDSDWGNGSIGTTAQNLLETMMQN